ncbi:hypothetical protein [Pantanalinema sp. GBBB05]|uniref:hypothetical protein n=1 Tax=Pantanalinema sp. GBBB05 TaxID=2604139 RepID=UPI001D889BD8|nr:hypothetical protein [Pantanalinema sp. GBBB05]
MGLRWLFFIKQDNSPEAIAITAQAVVTSIQAVVTSIQAVLTYVQVVLTYVKAVLTYVQVEVRNDEAVVTYVKAVVTYVKAPVKIITQFSRNDCLKALLPKAYPRSPKFLPGYPYLLSAQLRPETKIFAEEISIIAEFAEPKLACDSSCWSS